MKLLIIFGFAVTLTSAETKVDPFGRITNGKNASEGQFPYQVGLSFQRKKASSNEQFWCGGSIIDKEWVLTAAHCTEDVEKVTVYLGSIERMSGDIQHTVDAENVHDHPDWDHKAFKNDISLIKIPSIEFKDNIKSVKLPGSNDTDNTYEGEKATASGWGRTSSDKNTLADTLQYASFKVISNSECSKAHDYDFPSTNICVATEDGVSNCKGDSGGPLVLESSQVQIGLDSFSSEKGCEEGLPVGFTRLTKYLDWIKEKTGVSY